MCRQWKTWANKKFMCSSLNWTGTCLIGCLAYVDSWLGHIHDRAMHIYWSVFITCWDLIRSVSDSNLVEVIWMCPCSIPHIPGWTASWSFSGCGESLGTGIALSSFCYPLLLKPLWFNRQLNFLMKEVCTLCDLTTLLYYNIILNCAGNPLGALAAGADALTKYIFIRSGIRDRSLTAMINDYRNGRW